MIKVDTSDIEILKTLNAGDIVSISGTIYTARDAAHKKIFALMKTMNLCLSPFGIRLSITRARLPQKTANHTAVAAPRRRNALTFIRPICWTQDLKV